MNVLKTLTSILILTLTATLSFAAGAQTASQPGRADDNAAAPASASMSANAAAMTDGEIRKVDKETKKLTIKHGVIKNLDMPGMTMVFQVKDPALLDKVKAGDKVRFTAEMRGTSVVVTDIQTAPQR